MASSANQNVPSSLHRVLLGLALIELVFASFYWIDIASGGAHQTFHRLFNLDGEENLPTLFSSAQFIAIAVNCWTISSRRSVRSLPSPAFWIFSGFCAALLAIDEPAQLHERLTAVIGRRYVEWVPEFLGGNPILVLIVAISLGRWLGKDLKVIWRDHRTSALCGSVGIVIGLTGGMGLETIGYKLLSAGKPIIWYELEVTAEELMEMFGASLILTSTLVLKACITAEQPAISVTNLRSRTSPLHHGVNRH